MTPETVMVYASALLADKASCWTGSVIMESPPPAQPIKISPQSSVSKFSNVLPADHTPGKDSSSITQGAQ